MKNYNPFLKNRTKYPQYIPKNVFKKKEATTIFHDKPLSSFEAKMTGLRNKLHRMGVKSLNHLDNTERTKLLQSLGFKIGQYKKTI